VTSAETAQRLTLPVTGMTCANCVSTIERNLLRLDGVEQATVSLASERASVEFDPVRVDARRLVERVRRAGYDVALGDLRLAVSRLADDNDARRLERALRALPGVVEVEISYAAELARLRYLPTEVTPAELRRAVEAQGFGALERSAATEDVERAARAREIARQDGRSPRPTQPGDEAHEVRKPAHEVPVGRIERSRAHPHQHLIVTDRRLVDLLQLENVRRAVPLVHDRLHRFLLVRHRHWRCQARAGDARAAYEPR